MLANKDHNALRLETPWRVCDADVLSVSFSRTVDLPSCFFFQEYRSSASGKFTTEGDVWSKSFCSAQRWRSFQKNGLPKGSISLPCSFL